MKAFGRRHLFWIGLAVVFAAFVFFTFRGFLVGGVNVGDHVPSMPLSTLDGQTVDVADWRGEGIVLRLSSVSCTACADDFELMERWQEALGDQVRIAAVQVGDSAAHVRTKLSGRSFGLPLLLDPEAQTARAFGVQFVPAVVFITSRGTLSSVVHNEISMTDVPSHVRQLLAGGPHVDAELKRVAMQLRCQECEGRSIWESDAASSLELRERVYHMLLDGMRAEEILEYFEDAYGPWILMAPPMSGFTSLAWIFPVAAVGLGGALWWRLMLRARRRVRERRNPDTEAGEDHDALIRRIDDYFG